MRIHRAVIQSVSLHSWHTIPDHSVPLKMKIMSTKAMMMKKKKKKKKEEEERGMPHRQTPPATSNFLVGTVLLSSE